MTYSQGSLSTHSTSDDEESPTVGLLEGKSSIETERRYSTQPARLFRLYFVLLHLVLLSLALSLVMIQWAHPRWKANHELVEGSTWCKWIAEEQPRNFVVLTSYSTKHLSKISFSTK